MAKERLSKLQKWILITCYQTPNKGMARQQIINEFFRERTPVIEAVLSRSIWILIDRGFIMGISPMAIENMALVYGMIGKSKKDFEEHYKDVLSSPRKEKVAGYSMKGFNKVKIITLADKGETKAKELLKVK